MWTALEDMPGHGPELGDAMTKALVRPEQPSDESAIRAVTIAAFADHPHSDQTEHRVIDELRSQGGLALSLVAVADGQIVGHVAFSPVIIGEMEKGWYALAPLSVAPPFQR